MKKILAMLLVLAMALSLAACGGEKESTAAPAATQAAADAAPTAITLKVWAPQVDQESDDSWLPIMLAKFEEAHPEYVITWDVVSAVKATLPVSSRTTPLLPLTFTSTQMTRWVPSSRPVHWPSWAAATWRTCRQTSLRPTLTC